MNLNLYDFDENLYFVTINKTQNAKYENNTNESTNDLNENIEYFNQKNDEQTILNKVCSMDDLCKSSLFVL